MIEDEVEDFKVKRKVMRKIETEKAEETDRYSVESNKEEFQVKEDEEIKESVIRNRVEEEEEEEEEDEDEDEEEKQARLESAQQESEEEDQESLQSSEVSLAFICQKHVSEEYSYYNPLKRKLYCA